jgi:hypothetical protein
MTLKSAATYVTAPVSGNDIAAAVEATRADAANRLSGSELTLVSMNTLGEPGSMTVGATWRREWEEAEAPAEPTE